MLRLTKVQVGQWLADLQVEAYQGPQWAVEHLGPQWVDLQAVECQVEPLVVECHNADPPE